MDFNKSKNIGDFVEREILKRIQYKYSNAYIDDRGKKFSDWDIYIPEMNFGVEVKYDYMSKKTGNLVIEVEMYNKPSALSITKAKYWVFIDGFRIIWIRPIEIYRFLEKKQYRRVSFVGNGDGVSKLAYLISRDDLVLYVYNTLDKSDGWVEVLDVADVLYDDNILKIINDDE